MKTMDELRSGVASAWESLTEGWDGLRTRAAQALTRFRPGEKSNLPAAAELDEPLAGSGWGLIGGDVFEDEQRVVVRLEAPGMDKRDFELEVVGDALIVRGEKRFERERSEGRWRVVQCAYGSFHRSVPLPAAVNADQAQASYRNGVLRVELPKQQPKAPQARQIPVA